MIGKVVTMFADYQGKVGPVEVRLNAAGLVEGIARGGSGATYAVPQLPTPQFGFYKLLSDA